MLSLHRLWALWVAAAVKLCKSVTPLPVLLHAKWAADRPPIVATYSSPLCSAEPPNICKWAGCRCFSGGLSQPPFTAYIPSQRDVPYNGGSYVNENGFGHEQYNFAPVQLDDGQYCCLGFVETKTTSKFKRNDLHIEKISDCELLKKEDSVYDVLVVWCATTDLNETSIVGWYKDATVYRTYQNAEFDSEYNQEFNVLANKENCVLLPQGERHRHIWNAPTAKKRTYGFGQSMIWYATEENATAYIEKLTEQISEYTGENWIDKSAEDTCNLT